MSQLPPPDPSRFSRGPGADGAPIPSSSGRGRGRSAKPARQPRAASASGARPTKRVISSYRLLALAAAVAIILVVVGYKYTQGQGTYEAVYAQPMVAGATLSNASTATPSASVDITAAKVSSSEISPGAFTDSTAAGAIAEAEAAISPSDLTIGAIPAGTPVLASQYSPALVPVGKLGPDQLVSIDATIDNAVGGSLQTGDYVDVYLAQSVSNKGISPAILVAGSIQIVSIHASASQYNAIASEQGSNRTLNPTDVLPTTPVPGIYILQVTPTVAAEIATAQGTNGTFYLTYVAPPAS
jgi:Flp pilus assembly protein CpaB